MILNDEQINRYKQDGALVIRDAFKPKNVFWMTHANSNNLHFRIPPCVLYLKPIQSNKHLKKTLLLI